MLLLAEQWGWPSIPMGSYNATRNADRPAEASALSQEQQEVLEESNAFDQQLYRRGVTRFEEAVAAFDDMPGRLEKHRRECETYEGRIKFLDQALRLVGRRSWR